MWIFKIQVPPSVSLRDGEVLSREIFFERLWLELEPFHLQGVVEGTVVTQDVPEWVLDEAVPPQDRDLLNPERVWDSELYFESEANALQAYDYMSRWTQGVELSKPQSVEEKDWNAEWKSHFGRIDLGGGLWIVPSWDQDALPTDARWVVRIEPGAGFGTGTHETTQLCAEQLQRFVRPETRVLDFGSGSGVLAILALLMGAREALGVEVDPLAIDNAKENARLNAVEERVRWAMEFETRASEGAGYSLGVANILKTVLIPYAEAFVNQLKPDAPIVLSGLLAADVEPVLEVYSRLRPTFKVQVLERGDWRALVFVPPEPKA